MGAKTYKEAGVDIERGDSLVKFIQTLKSKAVQDGIGAFSSALELDLKDYRSPLLFSSADGVGTKLLVAKSLNRYDTIGIDLVAMCANDILVCGARPLLFLDYIACGKIDQDILQSVIRGIVKGCETAGCSLAGGETAEMPDMYGETDIDLAGFCIGIGEKEDCLPQKTKIKAGDCVMGLPSSGIHSNGFSLARKILTETDELEEMLTPTLIYTREMAFLRDRISILAAAHVTGGGLYGNLARVIPENLFPNLSFSWERPQIFKKIQEKGEIAEEEMRNTFNLGIGLALVIPSDQEEAAKEASRQGRLTLLEIGRIEERE